MKIIGVIPSRYQSSRFPGKPLAMINSRPMIWWVYQQALKVPNIDEVIIATDDERIEETCRSFGMNVMMTSAAHRTGADRVAEAARRTDGDIYLNIQGDEPLIDPHAISQIIDAMLSDPSCYYVGLRSRLEGKDELNNPNVVKTVTDRDGYAIYFSRAPIPYNDSYDAAYRVMGLYGYTRDFLLKFQSWGQSTLELAENGVEMLRAMEHGYRIKLLDTKYHSIGVDLPEHIQQVEEIMNAQHPATI